jgi:Zn-finger nucleic acid-binding protein
MGVKLTCHDCGAVIDSEDPEEITSANEDGSNRKVDGLFDDCPNCGGAAVDNEVTHYVLGHLWSQTPEEYAHEERLRAELEKKLQHESEQKTKELAKSFGRPITISSRYFAPFAALSRIFLFLFGVSWLCKSIYMAIFLSPPSWEVMSSRSAGPIVMPIVLSAGLIAASFSPGSIWKNKILRWTVWIVFCLIMVLGLYIGAQLSAELVLSPFLGAGHWVTGIVGWFAFIVFALLTDGLYETIRDRKRTRKFPNQQGPATDG